MLTQDIADIHCDLLTYLYADPSRTPHDAASRCSIPQMEKGHVKHQVMAVWAVTERGSSLRGEKQWNLFHAFPTHTATVFPKISSVKETSPPLQIFPSIENGSAFAEEDETMEEVLDRFHRWIALGKPVYVSLTWNGENRFGGGAGSPTGLKEEGMQLLEILDAHGIAVDLSHASDALAEDILSYVERKKLTVPIMASHSNFRAVTEGVRNLPDEIAKEIVRRGGIIGLNFIRHFVGERKDPFLTEHVSHALTLGIERGLCFGGDFFCDADLPENLRTFSGPSFFEEAPDASIYPQVLHHWKKELGLSEALMSGIAHQHFLKFIHQ